MDDKREARFEGGRRFQREGATKEKDLDMAMVALVRAELGRLEANGDVP